MRNGEGQERRMTKHFQDEGLQNWQLLLIGEEGCAVQTHVCLCKDKRVTLTTRMHSLFPKPGEGAILTQFLIKSFLDFRVGHQIH